MGLFCIKFYSVGFVLRVFMVSIIILFATYFTIHKFFESIFEEIIKGKDKEILLETIDAFHKAMKEKEVTYFMYSGTLLGSWRHHGLVPWDDDVDVMVPKGQSDLVRSALGVLQPEFHLNTDFKLRWKFYSNRSRRWNSIKHGWPYIDISFYLSNKTHLWDEDVRNYPNFKFRRDLVFPLKERPFLGRMLPAPADTKVVLSITYDLRMCQLGTWNHREEENTYWMAQVKVPCEALETVYTFVKHVQVGNMCSEYLDGNEIIERFNQNNSTC